MRLLFRFLVYATLAMVLLIAVVIGDLVFNKRRLFYAALGRDALIAACRPAVSAKLLAAGFEPADIEFGEEPDILFSTATGKTMTDTVTFQDGALQTRVDAVVTCGVREGTVTASVRTRSSPLRAT